MRERTYATGREREFLIWHHLYLYCSPAKGVSVEAGLDPLLKRGEDGRILMLFGFYHREQLLEPYLTSGTFHSRTLFSGELYMFSELCLAVTYTRTENIPELGSMESRNLIISVRRVHKSSNILQFPFFTIFSNTWKV